MMPILPRATSAASCLKAYRFLTVLAVASRIAVSEADVLHPPPQLDGPPLQGVLESAAFLVVEDLMGAGLSDVDDGQPLKVGWVDQFACAHGLSP